MKALWIVMACIQVACGLIMAADYFAGNPASAWVYIWAGVGVLLGVLNSLEFARDAKVGADSHG